MCRHLATERRHRPNESLRSPCVLLQLFATGNIPDSGPLNNYATCPRSGSDEERALLAGRSKAVSNANFNWSHSRNAMSHRTGSLMHRAESFSSTNKSRRSRTRMSSLYIHRISCEAVPFPRTSFITSLKLKLALALLSLYLPNTGHSLSGPVTFRKPSSLFHSYHFVVVWSMTSMAGVVD